MKKVSLSLVIGFVLTLATFASAVENTTFDMVRSMGAEAAGCIPNAKGRVTINSLGGVEVMQVEASGLPPSTAFDVFVIQLPNAPFGLAWYQGDLTTNSKGRGISDFAGRFSIETFIVAPGSGAAPVVFNNPPFPDASTNPATGPVHTYHVGIWFDSPTAAGAAGCPSGVTPFNGPHNAGVQALSTRNFPDLDGPLHRIK